MDEEKAARKFLEGLKSRERMPWDEPLSGVDPKPRPAAPSAPKPAPKPRSVADDASDQIEKIAKRNKELADRTRHLRGGSRSY